jgi:para-nitrobenzyl esterase
MYGAQRAATVTELFLSGLGLRPEQAERLRDVPADRLTAAGTTLVSAVPARTPGVLAFAPVIDGDVLPEHPVDVFAAGRALPLPLLIGTNKDEASGFARMKSPIMPVEPDTIAAMLAAVAADQPEVLMPDEARIQAAYRDLKQSKVGLGIARDIGFRMPTVWVAQGQQQVADTYLYRFDHAPPFLELIGIGASHATELPYVFGNLQSRGPKDLTFRLGGLRAARRLSVRMQRRWLSFAVTGVPTGVDGPAWPAYTDDRRATMVFDRRERVVDDLDAPLRQAWGDAVLSYR